MFFIASKAFVFFTSPTNVLILVLIVGTILSFTRRARVGRCLVAAAAILLVIVGISPLGASLIYMLENRFPAWDASRGAPTGFIILGGVVDPALSAARHTTALEGSAERVTIVADHGTVVKSGDGSFLVLEDGNLQRFEASKREPARVVFGRYAFDMSKFSNQGHDAALGIRERYLWELLDPAADDPVYMQLPGQFRAELHDRFMSPIYPFAFAALTFAFLGAPRTTRQSRNFSIGGSILAVFGLRMAGFACSVMAVKSPLAPLVQYLMLAAAIGAGIWIILAGVVVELPAALLEAINKSNARVLRLFGRPVAA